MSNFLKIIDIISKFPLFQGLAESQLAALSDILIDQTFEKYHTIFTQGENAAGFYAVVTGKVKIFKTSPDGKEQIIHIYGAGNIFGEVPMFSGGNFPANAETLERSRLFFFPRNSFIELIKTEPSLAMNMLAELSKKLRHLAHLVEELSLKEVPGRLASYLLLLSDNGKKAQVELDVTKTQLAGLLGTIPETLSRILGRMVNQGIIEVSGGMIKIINLKGLRELSTGVKNLF